MPLLKLETNVPLSEEQRTAILPSLSAIVAETLGKPEKYVMVAVNPSAVLMSGKPGGAAFADIRSIGGLNDDVNRLLAQRVCRLLNESLAISPDRVYLNFIDVKDADWGWNGDTFG